MITQDELKKIVNYNPLTGIFTWLVSRGAAKAGTRAGSICGRHRLNRKGCRYTQRTLYRRIGGKGMLEHKLAFLYMTGEIPKAIDHINHDGTDNRWCNLRAANHEINGKNQPLYRTNKFGLPGVAIVRGKYQVYIQKKYLYYGDDFFEACCRRKSAENKNNYHAFHGRNV